jgi:hypothetical protein
MELFTKMRPAVVAELARVAVINREMKEEQPTHIKRFTEMTFKSEEDCLDQKFKKSKKRKYIQPFNLRPFSCGYIDI